MNRRTFLRTSVTAGSAVSLPAIFGVSPANAQELRTRAKPFELDERGIPELKAGMESGRYTAVSLAKKYLARIEDIDRRGPAIRSVIELNPDALEIARTLDKERRAGKIRGPLHGIPILIKDNLDTGDRMQTTAGSLALQGSSAAKDAFVVERLRDAGAVIIGKTNLSEWANFRGHRSTSGWSTRGGQTRNPYVLDRNPSGSSSGSAAAVAANLCAAAVGTETDGSILSPSSYNGVVGLKPTVGLVSRSGIIPISRSQDTAGPMARTVTDVACLLGAMTGADSADPATSASIGHFESDYTRYLKADGLKGARLGVARHYFRFPDAVQAMFNKAIEALKAAGAELIDPVEAPGFSSYGKHEMTVLQYEFKTGLNEYLASRNVSGVRNLKELIAYNEQHRDRELRWFGQELLVSSQEKGDLTDSAYKEARAAGHRSARDEGIDAAMNQHKLLDAIIVPAGGPAHVTDWILGDSGMGSGYSIAAVAGYPSITVPAGQVHGLPVGLAFLGRAWSEGKLLQVAYAFEQATRHRRPPQFLSSLTV